MTRAQAVSQIWSTLEEEAAKCLKLEKRFQETHRRPPPTRQTSYSANRPHIVDTTLIFCRDHGAGGEEGVAIEYSEIIIILLTSLYLSLLLLPSWLSYTLSSLLTAVAYVTVPEIEMPSPFHI